MSDLIFKDDFMLTKRFSCNCLAPWHIFDVSVELDKNKKLVECGFDLYMDGKAPLKYRLKQAWNLLCGRDGCLEDFILRPEDVGEMIEILERAKGEVG